mgnify:CR=1 FL=1
MTDSTKRPLPAIEHTFTFHSLGAPLTQAREVMDKGWDGLGSKLGDYVEA